MEHNTSKFYTHTSLCFLNICKVYECESRIKEIIVKRINNRLKPVIKQLNNIINRLNACFSISAKSCYLSWGTPYQTQTIHGNLSSSQIIQSLSYKSSTNLKLSIHHILIERSIIVNITKQNQGQKCDNISNILFKFT